MTRDELTDLISGVTTLLGTALAREVELKESIASDAADSQRAKLDALKAKLAAERAKLQKLNAASKRKKELEKLRQTEGRSGGTVTLRDSSGRTIGFVRVMGPNRTDFFDRTGKLVAREVGNTTFSASGRAVYRGKLGLVALGERVGIR